MNKNKIEKFLGERDSRVTTIETANTLFQTLGHKKSMREIFHSGLNKFEAECITQYFVFSQKTLVDFMFMNFITVIGGYDANKDSLKAWENIPFFDTNEKNAIIEQLKTIRSRYAEARNNLICHIGDKEVSCPVGVPTKQIEEDIENLRMIFNIVRQNNNISPVIMGYSPSQDYSVIGLKKIISVLGQDELNLSQQKLATE